MVNLQFTVWVVSGYSGWGKYGDDNVRGGNERLFLCIQQLHVKPDPGIDSEAIIKEDRGE